MASAAKGRFAQAGEQLESVYYQPTERESKLLSLFDKEKRNIESSSSDLRDTVKASRQNYLCKYKSPYTPLGREKVFVPLTREKVDAIAPKTQIKFDSLVVEPQEEGDIGKAIVAEQVIRYQARKMRFFEDLYNSQIRNLGIDGTLVYKLYWDFKEDKPCGYYVDPLNIWVNPEVDCLDDAPVVIERFRIDLHELKTDDEYAKMYKNLDKVMGKQTDDAGNTYDSRSTRNYDVGQNSPTTELPWVDVYECWTEDEVFAIADGFNRVVIRDGVNEYGFIPYTDTWYEKVARRWYGVGIGEKLRQLQMWVNQLVNQRIENREILLNKMFLVRRGSVKDKKQLASRPGGFIEVDNTASDIRPLDFSDITAASYQDESNIYTLAERVTGSYELGSGGGHARTASEVLVKSRGIEGRFGLVKKTLEDFAVRVFGKVLEMDRKFLTDQTVIRITGTEDEVAKFDMAMGVKPGENSGKARFLRVSNPEALDGNFDIRVDFDDTAEESRALRAKQLLDLLAIAGSDPAQPLSPEDRLKVYREFLRLQGITLKLSGLTRKPGIPGATDMAAMMGEALSGAGKQLPRPKNGGGTEAEMNGYANRVTMPTAY